MTRFNVTVREHSYTGRFYSDVVQAESCEDALQVAGQQAAASRLLPGPKPEQGFDAEVMGRTHAGRWDPGGAQAERREEAQQPAAGQAAAPQPSPGPPLSRGFSVVVREQAYSRRFYSDVVQAESCEDALEAAAARATAPRPLLDPRLQADATGRPRCADVWVYSLLHCELVTGHDPPHMAVAHGYGRLASWVRDDRGIAHPPPDPAAGAHVVSPVTQPSPALDREAEQQAPAAGWAENPS